MLQTLAPYFHENSNSRDRRMANYIIFYGSQAELPVSLIHSAYPGYLLRSRAVDPTFKVNIPEIRIRKKPMVIKRGYLDSMLAQPGK